MKRFFGMIFPLLLSIAWFSAGPLPTAQATNDVPEGLTPAEWAQIQNQLDPDPTPTWTEQVKLTPNDVTDNAYFGSSVAVSGNTVIIGAQGSSSKSAYIFVRDGGSWRQQAKLTSSNPSADDWFGSPVAIYGDTAVVGAMRDDDGGAGAGSVYVFVRNGDSWSQQAKLTASDSKEDDMLGGSIGISGDTVIIGASGLGYYAVEDNMEVKHSGSVYIFVRNSGSWSQQAKLTASDSAEFSYFGGSIAISGDTAIISAVADNDGGENSGSAYIFVRNGGSWSQQAKLTANDVVADGFFGNSVAISGDTAIISANESEKSSSVYVFVRNGGSWSQQAKLTASDASAEDTFGWSVALSDNIAIIGAAKENNNGIEGGAAYVFVREGENWNQQIKLTASDLNVEDFFGDSVAVSGNTVIIGAVFDEVDRGAAYIFAPSTLMQKIYHWFVTQAGY